MSMNLTVLKTYLATLEKKFNQRNERERLTIFAILLMLIFLFWLGFVWRPLAKQQAMLTTQLQPLEKIVDLLEQRYEQDKRMENQPPSVAQQVKLQQLQMQHLQLNTQLATLKQAAQAEHLQPLLSALSNVGTQLNLDQLDNIPDPNAAATKKPSVFTPQYFQLQFHGGYFATSRYLEYLENLPWYLVIDHFQYQVEEYPNAQVKIILHTLVTSSPDATKSNPGEGMRFPDSASTFAKATVDKSLHPGYIDPTLPFGWSPQKLSNLELTAIFHKADQSFAIINGETCQVGSVVKGYEVTEVTPSAVYLRNEKGLFMIQLVNNVKTASL